MNTGSSNPQGAKRRFSDLKPMKSAAILWLPFVGNYRTFLNNPAVDAGLFGAAMLNMA